MARKRKTVAEPASESYKHPQASSLSRPDVGTQAQFKKRKPPKTYKYDSSLSPSLEWDGKNKAREEGEAAIAEIANLAASQSSLLAALAGDARGGGGVNADSALQRVASDAAAIQAAAEKLRAISKPFLNWSGKAERLSFDVPTLPLFVHERLSTKAIIETLRGHRRSKETQLDMFDLFGDPNRSIADQVLRAYEYQDKWTNRLILGDALAVMNSLVSYENLGGQVQMIYMDPPYGVKFGSNFQPFVRKRDVKHGDDDDFTREPEMVQAYRDTWELGLHSYLTYLRDRLLLSRDLLSPTGSIFVQISTENLHLVTALLDEVFGAGNRVELISFRKKTMPLGGTLLEGNCDYLVWYAKNKDRVRYRTVFQRSKIEGDAHWNYVELPDGMRRAMTAEEIANHRLLPEGSTPYQLIGMYPAGSFATGIYDFEFEGTVFKLPSGKSWKTPIEGMQRLATAKRLQPYSGGSTLRYVLKHSDYPVTPLDNVWDDTSAPSDKQYVVQTSNLVVQRCILMTTDPGDLVLDPTCGSGTTAYVAEQWGRRWITIDVSRVPLALARQRLLTATFPWYELKDDSRGPAGGFVYKRKQNRKGEEIGGIVPHITLKSIANNEPPAEEVLVDRPEIDGSITRVTGPFCVEATIPTPMDFHAEDVLAASLATRSSAAETYANFAERMLEVLRKSPVLRLEGNRTVQLANIRPPARSLSLSAEALLANGNSNLLAASLATRSDPPPGAPNAKRVAIVFGPESGAVSEKLVFEAAKEAYGKSYDHLYVIGFAIQAGARELIDKCAEAIGIAATYIQATPDLLMGDLLKNMRSSQIFSVCGLPEIEIHNAEDGKLQVELKGLDIFDPVTMEPESRPGNDVPCWMLDTDYNDLCFHAGQVFFPRTSAWENLRKALRGTHDESVWDHLAGTTSAPFEPGDNRKVAVKVIDDRGNELLVVKELK